MINQSLFNRVKRQIELTATVQKERSEKRKFWTATISLIIATVGVVGGALLYYYQIEIQSMQNQFQRIHQIKQFKLDSVLENKKFEYTIIEKSSELPTIKAVVVNLDNYIGLHLLSGEPNHYQKLLAENRWENIPFTGRKFAFNTDEKDLPLLEVADHTTNPCNAGPANGCWTRVIYANLGDLISVQLYFHNTADTAQKKVAGGITPEWTGANRRHVFYGAIAADQEIDLDSALVITPQPTILAFVPKSVRFYPDQSAQGHTISGEENLFLSHGINLGDIGAGWNHQGVLVADFRVVEAK